ncbi:MAG: ATP-binding cassette domain-containing protein, partial [Actinobacteria bacterium]|nr:ATP-binding cassette domain-containing protein [Actinomycetota bacterium]
MDQVAVRARDVSIELGGRAIWSEGTFELPAGGVYAIIGPNGSGKTTMLRALLGLLPVAG